MARWMTDDWRDNGFEHAIRHALANGVTLREISAGAAETAIRLALQDESENVPRAARKLGVTDRALQLRRAADRRRSGSIFDKDTGTQGDPLSP